MKKNTVKASKAPQSHRSLVRKILYVAIGIVSALDLYILLASAISDLGNIGMPAHCVDNGTYVSYQDATNVYQDVVFILLALGVVILAFYLWKRRSMPIKYISIALVGLIVVGVLALAHGLSQSLNGIQCIPF